VQKMQNNVNIGCTIRNAKRLQPLTDDLLDVIRIESQSLCLKDEQFNLTNVINDTLASSDAYSRKERNIPNKIRILSFSKYCYYYSSR
jgi:signal transduction histidine kinase